MHQRRRSAKSIEGVGSAGIIAEFIEGVGSAGIVVESIEGVGAQNPLKVLAALESSQDPSKASERRIR